MSRETARHDVSVPLEGLSLDPSRTETRHFRIRDVSVSRLALGHPRTPLPAGLRATSGPQGHRAGLTVSVPAGGEAWPRLLGAGDAARYLGVGEDTVLELLRTGTLHRVRIPAPVTTKRRGGEIRRVLLDRAELDALIGAGRGGWGPRGGSDEALEPCRFDPPRLPGAARRRRRRRRRAARRGAVARARAPPRRPGRGRAPGPRARRRGAQDVLLSGLRRGRARAAGSHEARHSPGDRGDAPARAGAPACDLAGVAGGARASARG